MRTGFGWILSGAPRASSRVEFETDRDGIADYAVLLLAGEEGQEETVRLYDGSHGSNELHRYTRLGGKQPAEVFHRRTLGEGMRSAVRQILSGYQAMIESWQKT